MTRRAAACTTDPRPSVCPPGVVPTLRATRLQKSTDRCRARSGLVTLKAKSPKGASALQLAATGVAVAWRAPGVGRRDEEGTASARPSRARRRRFYSFQAHSNTQNLLKLTVSTACARVGVRAASAWHSSSYCIYCVAHWSALSRVGLCTALPQSSRTHCTARGQTRATCPRPPLGWRASWLAQR